MAVYAKLADGRRLEFPDGTSQEVMDSAVKKFIASEKPPKTGIGAALVGGAERLGSSLQTGIESLFDAEGAARRGAAREEEISQKYAPGANLEAVKKAYEERGLFPAIGEVARQIPGALAEQAPNIAASLGGARLGAMAGAPLGPVGALVGGIGGAALPSILQIYGSGLERQAEENADISRGRALGAAVVGGGLETAATLIPLGRSIVGKLLGPQAEKALIRGERDAVENMARQGFAQTLGRGVAVGALAEIPTEVTQQILERAQAGLDLTSDDALAEYGQAAYGAALVGAPFGAAGRFAQRGVARGEIAEKEAKARTEEERKAAAEAQAEKEKQEAFKTTPEYRQELNGKIVEAKDELRSLEDLLKDKTLDPDVKDEAKVRAKELRTQIGDLSAELKKSAEEAGVAPTLKDALARKQAAEEPTIVDDFGNVVKPKTKGLTPEEEAAGYEAQVQKAAAYYAEREKLLDKLREEEQARKEKADVKLKQSVQNYLTGLDQIEEANTEVLTKRLAEKRKISEQEAAQEITLDRIQLLLDNFGLRAAGVEPEERKQIESAINEGKIDRNVTKVLGIKGLGGKILNASEAMPNIQSRIDELNEGRQKALFSKDPLMDENGQLTPMGYSIVSMEAKLRELARLKDIGTQQAPEETPAEATIAPAIQAAERAQAEPLAVEVQPNLAKAAYDAEVQQINLNTRRSFVDLASFVDDIKNKRFLSEGSAPEQIKFASSTREGLLDNIQKERKNIVDGIIREVAVQRVAQKLRPLSRDEGIALGIDIDSLINMFIERSLAPAPGMITETIITPAQVRGAKTVVGATETEVDTRTQRQLPFGAVRRAKDIIATFSAEQKQKLELLKKNIKVAENKIKEIDAVLNVMHPPKPADRQVVLPESEKAQNLGAKRIKALDDLRKAKKALALWQSSVKATAPTLSEKQALQNIKNVIRSIKQSTIAEGKRPVQADKQILRMQSKATPTESQLAQGERVVEDIQRVLAMPFLDPDVSETLSRAADIIANRRANPSFVNTVDEQVGRILRGTDRPFVPERDVNKPSKSPSAIKKITGEAKDAALLNEIKQDMDTQAALRAYAEEGVDAKKDARLRANLENAKKELADADLQIKKFTGETGSEEDKKLTASRKKAYDKVQKAQNALEESRKVESAQTDLFPETLATTRATPAAFQRLVKSGAVASKRAALAEAKRLEIELRTAKKQLEVEQAAWPAEQEKKILEEIAKLAANIKRGLGDKISVTTSQKFAALDDRIKKLVADYKQKANIKPESEIVRGERLLTKFLREDSEKGEPFQATKAVTKAQIKNVSGAVDKRIEGLEKKLKAAEAAVKEVAENLKAWEQRFKPKYKNKAKERARQLLDAREKFAEEIRQQIATAQQLRNEVGSGAPTSDGKIESVFSAADLKAIVAALDGRIADVLARKKVEPVLSLPERLAALNLPTTKVTTEYETVKVKGRARPVTRKVRRIVDVQEAEAVQRRLATYAAESKRSLSAGVTFQNLEQEEKQAIEQLRAANKEVKEFTDLVNQAKSSKNFKKYEGKLFAKLKELGDSSAAAKNNLLRIRANKKLLDDFNQVEKQVKRNPAQRTVPGVITESQRNKYTIDQMYDLFGERGRMLGPKEYYVEDTIDLRLGTKKPTQIVNKEQAEKRLTEIKERVDNMLPKRKDGSSTFNFYPSVAQAPIKISNQMARQGLDPMVDTVKGGVLPDGTVFVIIDAHESMLDLEKTLAHELIGHYSFESLLGQDGMTKLMLKLEKDLATDKQESGLQILAYRLGLGSEYAGALAETYAFYKDKLDRGEITEKEVARIAKTKGLRELVAYTMERKVDKAWYAKAAEFIKEIVRAIRGRLMYGGLTEVAKQSTSDLFYLMKQAQENFDAGKPMAYRNSDGTVSFRTVEKPPATGLSALISQRGSFFDAVKANTLGLSGLNFRTQFVDRLAALDALVKRGVEKKVISSLKAMDVMYFSRMVDQRNNFVSEFATNGVGKITMKNGERMYTGGTGPSLRDVSEALRDSGVDPKQVENAFTEYLIALRATKVGLKKLDFSGKTTQADVDAALAKYKNNAAFNKAAKLYDEYNDNLLDFLASTGAISEADAAKMKGQNYVPYYREANGGIELVISKELAPIRIGNFKDQPHLNELKGGEDKVVPAFTGMLQNTSLIVDLALRNMATRNTAHVLQDMGVMKIHKGEGPASAEVIRFKRDGEKFYAIPDKEAKDTLFGDIPIDLVIRGMEGIKTTIPGIVRMLGVPSNILRKFVTRNPKYAVNQIFRDSMAAVMTTGADFIPIVDTVKDLMTMKKSGALRTLQGSGAIGGQVITGASDDMAKILQQIAAGKAGWELAMAKLDELAMMGDAATRVSMYNSFLKQGLSEREATFATLEAMNFGRRGLSPSMTFANIMIPFFNANVQGLDVLWRAFKGDMPASERLRVRNKLIARGMLMAAFTFAYAAAMDDDETYENANPDERYGNWFVPTSIGTVRVPIPFELGFIFKAIPEGVYRYAFTDDKGSAVAKAMGSMLMKSVPGDLPTAIKAPVELALNKSFYTGRPIIDEKLQGLISSEQYKPNTPELIKMFGAIGLSPVQVEYFIRSFTGTLPVALMRIVDPVFVSSEDKPEMKLEEVPVIGGFFQPKDAGGLINAAFEHVKQAREAQQTYKHMIEEGRLEDAKKFLQENIADVSLASAAGSFRQQMGKIVKAEQAIRASALSPEEKRERLDEMRELKIKMAKQFTSVSEQIKAQTSP